MYCHAFDLRSDFGRSRNPSSHRLCITVGFSKKQSSFFFTKGYYCMSSNTEHAIFKIRLWYARQQPRPSYLRLPEPLAHTDLGFGCPKLNPVPHGAGGVGRAALASSDTPSPSCQHQATEQARASRRERASESEQASERAVLAMSLVPRKQNNHKILDNIQQLPEAAC